MSKVERYVMAEKKAKSEEPRESRKPSAILDNVLAQIQKEFGDGAIMRLGDASARVAVPSISTGAFSLDLALGVGGLPRGRVTEIFGPESSGKTTLALHVIANAQKSGGVAAFIDAEHAMDPLYAKKIGVNIDDLLVSQPSSGEEALTIAETLIRSNAMDVVVIDSVAALTPRAEIEGEMGDPQMGLQARLMSQALRKLTAAISSSKTCCIFTNQLREKIGVMFGNPETTPGGKALKFYASIRLDIRKIGLLKDSDGRVFGNHTRVKVVKNKVAPPFLEAEFNILYAEGISWAGSVVDAAIQYNVIEKRGSWLSLAGEHLGQGRDAVVELVKSNKDIEKKLIDAVTEKLKAVSI
jgi:recombination protein RecA